MTHKRDFLYYVGTGGHRCTCGWVPRARRDDDAIRSIAAHARSAASTSAT